jgi:hypothetical protein
MFMRLTTTAVPTFVNDESKIETVNVAYTTITDELKSHFHIGHSDGPPYPSPVPDDLDPSRAAIEHEALRLELLIAPFNPDPTAGKCDIGNLPTAVILSVRADLR